MLRRKNPCRGKGGGWRGPGHPQTGGTSVTSPGIPVRLPSIPGWGTGLGGFPLSLRGPHPPGGVPLTPQGPQAPPLQQPSAGLPLPPHSSSGSPLPGGVPFPWGRSPVSPGAPGPPPSAGPPLPPLPPLPPPSPCPHAPCSPRRSSLHSGTRSCGRCTRSRACAHGGGAVARGGPCPPKPAQGRAPGLGGKRWGS